MADRLKQVRNYFSEGFLSYVSFLKFLNNALYEKMRVKKVFLEILKNPLSLIRQRFGDYFLNNIDHCDQLEKLFLTIPILIVYMYMEKNRFFQTHQLSTH